MKKNDSDAADAAVSAMFDRARKRTRKEFDTGNRPPNVHWVVETGSAVMGASPPGAHIRAEAESMNSSRVTIRDERPNHGHAHIADVTVWASGSKPLTEETIAVASAIYWSWWRTCDMLGEAP